MVDCIQVELEDASKPASVCAAIRHAQTMELCKQPAFVNWLKKQWGRRNFFKDLLGFTLKENEKLPRDLYQLHARVYCFSLQDQFHDSTLVRGELALWFDASAKRRKSVAVVVTPQAGLMVSFVKNVLQPGQVYSISSEVFDAAAKQLPLEEAPAPSVQAQIAAINQVADVYVPMRGMTFFEVVEVTPENAIATMPVHLAKSRSCIVVAKFTVLRLHPTAGSATVTRSVAPLVSIDIVQWCTPANLDLEEIRLLLIIKCGDHAGGARSRLRARRHGPRCGVV